MIDSSKIRNFSIIAHIDHGKSTLADRMLELTNTIDARRMKEQVLDTMELERERGITIKMQPVRMSFKDQSGEEYVLNLIDTPGHIDFSYEVSRALKAVEGSLLLVDATQGVQAQTFTTLDMAKQSGLKIIPVLSKVDSPLARVEDVSFEIAELLECDPSEVILTSGKTGLGVIGLLEKVVAEVPSPVSKDQGLSALVFDFEYSEHRGVIVYVRIISGEVKKGDSLLFAVSEEKFSALEVGVFSPHSTPKDSLGVGEIGYIVTGIKKAGVASVGDTVTMQKSPTEPLSGYKVPVPVVWASVYPESQDDFDDLRSALGRLKLSDSSLSFEEESSGTLGRGYRCGFLGMLHLEIVTERLRREHNLDLIITSPTVTYEITHRDGHKEIVYAPALFPDHGTTLEIREPWTEVKIITPNDYLSNIMQLLYEHEADLLDTVSLGDRAQLIMAMPLRELMRNFFDELKSVSSGYASISYEPAGWQKADVTRLDILVAGEIVAAFSKVVATRRAYEEAETAVEKLHKLLPQQLFVVKIQGQALGRVLASRTLKALRKDVTAKLYGGDITRKMKLREKQKKGKKKMAERGRVNIGQDVFLKMMK